MNSTTQKKGIEPDQLRQLATLLKKHSALSDERERIKNLGPAVESELAEAIKTADFQDKAQFDAIATLRIKRDLLPQKEAHLDELLIATEAQIVEEVTARIADYEKLVHKVTAAARQKLITALSPVLVAAPEQSLRFEQTIENSAALRPFLTAEFAVPPEHVRTFGGVWAAQRLIVAWQSFLVNPPVLPECKL
jgi:hypothetical protein